MPIYPCECKACGHYDEPWLPVSEYDKLPECCGQQMARVFTAPFVVEDMKPYKSPIDGQWVTTRSQHRDHMKKHDVVEVGNEKLTRPARKEYKPDKELKKQLYEALK